MAEHGHHDHHGDHEHGQDGQPRVGYASPQEALTAPPEEFVYVAALHTGTGVEEPDLLAVVDVNPQSDTYGQVVHRTPMPRVGDELHHYGWQVCSSACHTDLQRQHLVVPGFRSSRMHITSEGPRAESAVKSIRWPYPVKSECPPAFSGLREPATSGR